MLAEKINPVNRADRSIRNAKYGSKGDRSSGVQEYRSSGVQEFRSTGVQEYRSSGATDGRMPVKILQATCTRPRLAVAEKLQENPAG
jgi:hypothetical protein